MSNLKVTDPLYHFEVIAGNSGHLGDGGLQDVQTPNALHLNSQHTTAGTTTPLSPGTIVISEVVNGEKQCKIPLTDGNVNKTDEEAPQRFWMVSEGNTDYEWSSRLSGNKVVLLRGNFTIRTAHVNGTLNVGDRVTVEHAASGNPATLPHQGGTNTGRLAAAAAGDPVLGFVSNKETAEGNVIVYEVEMSL